VQLLPVRPTLMNFTLIFNSNFNEHSAAAEMGDCLATIDMGQKLGAVPLCGKWVHI